MEQDNPRKNAKRFSPDLWLNNQPTPPSTPPPPRRNISRRDLFLLLGGGLSAVAIAGLVELSKNITLPNFTPEPKPATKPAEARPTQTVTAQISEPVSISESKPVPTYVDGSRFGTPVRVPNPVAENVREILSRTPTPDMTPTPVSAREISPPTDTPKVSGSPRSTIITTKETSPETLPLDIAKIIMGDNYFGPEALYATFGIDLNESVPPLYFNTNQLEKARQLDHFLILRTSRDKSGRDLTIDRMIQALQPQYHIEKKGEIKNPSQWPNSPLVTSEVASSRWALVTKGILPGSTNSNYADQTYLLAEYLRDIFYRDAPLPQVYEDALSELFVKEKEFDTALRSYWDGKGVAALVPLKLNQLLRHSPVELVYDLLVYYQTRDRRLLTDHFVWTKGVLSGVFITFLGKFSSRGIEGYNWFPTNKKEDLGTMISQTT